MKYRLILGLAIAIVVSLVDMAGGFRTLERKTIDLRWQAPRPSQPLSEKVALVLIDDGAIDRVGRWPWSRATIADLIHELHEAGAGTIALDLILSEESEGDDTLAVEIAEADCGLPVIIREEQSYDSAWRSPQGSNDFRNLMRVLGEDVQLEPAEKVLAEAKITDETRLDRYRQRPLEFKRAAAWDRLLDAESVQSFEDLERLVAPNKGEGVGDYIELATLKSVWRQFEAWRKLRSNRLLVDLLDRSSRGNYRDLAPLPIFAESVDFTGYVNMSGQRHADGVIREFDAILGGEGGFILPFGIAAAVKHLDLSPADVGAYGHLQIGKETLPLHRGRLWINWPKSDTNPRWLGLLKGESSSATDADYISARQLLELAANRRKHAGNRAELVRLTARILHDRDRRAVLAGDPLAPEKLEEVRDEASFLLELEPGAAVTADLIRARKWQLLENPPPTKEELDEQIEFVGLCARWLEIDGFAESEQQSLRGEWAELTVDIRLALAAPEWRAGLGSPEVLELTRTEVATLEGANAEESGRARLWQELEKEVGEGDRRIDEQAGQIRERLEDKLVFVGFAATGLADIVQTPLDPSTPGVVVHVVVASMILENRPVRFLGGWQSTLLTLAVGMMFTLFPLRFSPLPSAAAALLAAALSVAVVWWLFASMAFVLPFVGPMFASGCTWTACTTLQAATIWRERSRVSRQFKARVSDRLVDKLAANADELAVSGEEREVAVLFADLANFTSISEALGEKQTVSTLNRFLGALVKVLIENGTYVNKFMGDGLMAFWSAFEVDSNQAFKACHSALECQKVIETLNEDAQLEGLPKIGLRLGIATGRAIVGDCGAPPDLCDYTVIGDTVNLAARLESANKQFGTKILINGRTRDLLEEGSMVVRPLGRVVVIGQQTPTRLFELLPPDTSKELIEITDRAVNAYAARKFDEAIVCFDEIEKQFGPSKVADVFRDAIADAGEVFDGVLHLRVK